ncbi:peptidoglycan-recognition protein LC-like [Hylaeus anthracinus]|uniref:peptidoglycan-recognition protein LC-like n=1 Tax=Hylaeus anthracinus TaxID=313031 RepID=UPI0023B94574|nr:peptidoglycan-recognition protein LC-like [Hylaeus anthracinus]XP_054012658.1 peptidoglycan-recognition protein LC-like [Hylaeus anthracinus]
MVTLVQQHQQTVPDENSHQKDQDQANSNAVSNNHEAVNKPGEVVLPVKDIVARNGSLVGSSTQCSDLDDNDEEEEEETDVEDGDWVPDLPVPAVFQHQQQVTTADGNVVLPNADTSNFGDVRVKNSTNVHLGNKTFYKGPVTIKQFVYTNPIPVKDYDTVASASSHINASDLPNANGDANRPILSQNSTFENVTKWLWNQRCVAIFLILVLSFVTAVVVACVYILTSAATPPAPIFPEIPVADVGVENVRFVTRNEWGAQPPTEQLTKMKLPVPYVIISHTATDFCSTQSECTFRVRFAQTFHIESRNWSDIAYNFLVGGDGLVYVGRSWDYMGAQSFGYNNKSIAISFIGTFNTVVPPKSQLYAAQRLIELGVEAGKIAPDYKLLGHRQVSRTLSPGDALYSVIKTWPHWSPTP